MTSVILMVLLIFAVAVLAVWLVGYLPPEVVQPARIIIVILCLVWLVVVIARAPALFPR